MGINGRNIAIILVAIVLMATECEEKYIRFEEPIPQKARIIYGFDEEYTGTYCLESKNFEAYLDADSTYLSIDNQSIVKDLVLHEKFAKAEFDTMQNLKIAGNKVLDLEDSDSAGYPFTIDGDSISIKYHMKDTIFKVAENTVLKVYKKWFYLNSKVDELYEVSKMKYLAKDNILYLDHLQDSLDTKLLSEITSIKEITTPAGKDSVKIEGYKVNLTNRKLRKFLRKGGFTKNEVYTKLN